MKKTLLQIVQDILDEMDADNVNSIGDTVEAVQVASIVRSCYEEMLANRNWPHMKQLVQLEASGSTALPNYLRIPSRLKELEEVRYDKRKAIAADKLFLRITYKEPEDFLQYLSYRKSSQENIRVVDDPSGVQLLIVDNKAPEFYTSFDDEWLVFDSYNKTIEDTLQKSKTQAVAYIFPEWIHSDSAIPNLPDEAFPLLVAESKATAFFSLKQMINDKAEQKAQRQNRWLSRKAWRVKGGINYPDYGRK